MRAALSTVRSSRFPFGLVACWRVPPGPWGEARVIVLPGRPPLPGAVLLDAAWMLDIRTGEIVPHPRAEMGV